MLHSADVPPPGDFDIYAVIMGTGADIDKNCRPHGVICEDIPHHVNHNCVPRNDNWPLGSSNYTYLYKDLAMQLPTFGVLTEHGVGLCKFYDSISVEKAAIGVCGAEAEGQ